MLQNIKLYLHLDHSRAPGLSSAWAVGDWRGTLSGLSHLAGWPGPAAEAATAAAVAPGLQQRTLALRAIWTSLTLAALIALTGWAGLLPGSGGATAATWAQALPAYGGSRAWQASR